MGHYWADFEWHYSSFLSCCAWSPLLFYSFASQLSSSPDVLLTAQLPIPCSCTWKSKCVHVRLSSFRFYSLLFFYYSRWKALCICIPWSQCSSDGNIIHRWWTRFLAIIAQEFAGAKHFGWRSIIRSCSDYELRPTTTKFNSGGHVTWYH